MNEIMLAPLQHITCWHQKLYFLNNRSKKTKHSIQFRNVQRMAAQNKTPVMILQELMVKLKTTLEFNPIRQSGGKHNPVFEFGVQASPVTAIGVGRSKKEAKHNAAKNALKELSELGIYAPENDCAHVDTSPHSNSPNSDSNEVYQMNFVGQLKEFCAEKRLPDPRFELISDIGPPHARRFTITCSVISVKCTATACTKKLAKQSAAKKMLHRLMDTLGSGGVLVPCDDMAAFAPQAIDEVRNLSRQVSTYPFSLTELDSARRASALSLLNASELDAEEELARVLRMLDIPYTLDSLEYCDATLFGFTVKIYSDPFFEVAGFGASRDQAQSRAVSNAMDFLKVMLK